MPIQPLPTLVIGLGGSGGLVSRLTKEAVRAANSGTDHGQVRFLIVDTMQQPAGGHAGGHGPGGLFSAGETFSLAGDARPLGERIANAQPPLAQYAWFPARRYLDTPAVPWTISAGAGQYRQFGRIGMFMHVTALVTRLTSVLDALPPANRVIHVVASLAGGTGAGTIVDMVHLVRQLAPRPTKLITHLLLPEAFAGTPEVGLSVAATRQVFEARAFAALREINFLQGGPILKAGGYLMCYDPAAQVGTPLHARCAEPIDAVYLYDGARQNNLLNTGRLESGLAESISETLLGWIDQPSGAQHLAHVANFSPYRTAYNVAAETPVYGTVGSYTIELPMALLVRRWSNALARELLDAWLAPETWTASQRPDRLGAIPGETSEDAVGSFAQNVSKLTEECIQWAVAARGGPLAVSKVRSEILGTPASTWVKSLNIDPNQGLSDESRSTLCGQRLAGGQPNPNYVHHDPKGNGDDAKAAALQAACSKKLNDLVGPTVPGQPWRRVGGTFGQVATAVLAALEQSFGEGLRDCIEKKLLNAPDRRRGLGTALAFVAQMRGLIAECSALFREVENQHANIVRAPTINEIRTRLQAQYDAMRAPSWLGHAGERRQYRDTADELLQASKTDIIRQLVGELLRDLTVMLEKLEQQLSGWRDRLGRTERVAGGVYATLQEQQQNIENQINRKRASRVHMVVEEDLPDEQYLAGALQQYRAGQLDRLLQRWTWAIGADMTVNLTFDGTRWNHAASAQWADQHAEWLLAATTAPFAAAFDSLSVVGYLVANYPAQRYPQLTQTVVGKLGFPLTYAAGVAGPPMRRVAVAAHQGNAAEQNFLSALQNTLEQAFAGAVAAAPANQAAQVVNNVTAGTDRFRASVLLFGEMSTWNQAAPAVTANPNPYRRHAVPWQLHVLRAPQRALELERGLIEAGQPGRPPRELHESVVALLDDEAWCQLALECWCFGDDQFDWNDMASVGLLLHERAVPDVGDQREWVLMLAPPEATLDEGQRRFVNWGAGVPPVTHVLARAQTPSLMEALQQLIIHRADMHGMQIDGQQVRQTLELARHCQQHHWAAQHPVPWTIIPGINAQLERRVQQVWPELQRWTAFVDAQQQTLNQVQQPANAAADPSAVDLRSALLQMSRTVRDQRRRELTGLIDPARPVLTDVVRLKL
jgi:hypothetical protein